MKKEKILKLKNTELLEMYIKKVCLLEFYFYSWFRWLKLVENTSESIELIDGVINSINDNFSLKNLEDYKLYYKEVEEVLKAKLNRLSKILSNGDKHKAILFAEICKRDLTYDISKYKEIMEYRTKFYYKFIEGEYPRRNRI